MNEVVHFEILADDIDRASKFYQDVFGWQMKRWGDEPYILITIGEGEKAGTRGAIMPRIGFFSSKEEGYKAFVCTISVENIDEAIEKIKAAGGKQFHEKQDIPNVGTHAYCQDTEGNVFGVIQQVDEPVPAP